MLEEIALVEILYANVEGSVGGSSARLNEYKKGGTFDRERFLEDERKVLDVLKKLDDMLAKAKAQNDKKKQLEVLTELAKTWRLCGDLKRIRRTVL